MFYFPKQVQLFLPQIHCFFNFWFLSSKSIADLSMIWSIKSTWFFNIFSWRFMFLVQMVEQFLHHPRAPWDPTYQKHKSSRNNHNSCTIRHFLAPFGLLTSTSILNLVAWPAYTHFRGVDMSPNEIFMKNA